MTHNSHDKTQIQRESKTEDFFLRNVRDLDLNVVNTATGEQNISPEIQDCWEPSKSLTLPRKMKTKDSDDNEVENSQPNRNFYSLPRPKTSKV